MAQQGLTIAPRYTKPANFAGTETMWRSLCECYPGAETPEVLIAVVEYCAVRNLDPFKRPVHVVPMYNSRLRRKVQVVMQGINEIEITATRTGQWAGMDAPIFGPTIERTFTGEFENDDGSKRDTEIRMQFPEWCAVTVYRIVAGERRAFTEQLWWLECYGRAGFRSTMPNQRWQQAPRQMLHKCVKAAVLRAAFPEEGLGYTADEMEDREIDAGGITIDGKIDQGADRTTIGGNARDRQAAQAYPPLVQDSATAGPDPLDEQNGTKWLANLTALLAGAASVSDVVAIGGHRSVRKALAEAPTLIRAQITDMLRKAHERMAPGADGAGDQPTVEGNATSDDAVVEGLLAEVAAMDLITLNGLAANAQWIVRVRDLFPPDQDRITEAAQMRIVKLRTASREEHQP